MVESLNGHFFPKSKKYIHFLGFLFKILQIFGWKTQQTGPKNLTYHYSSHAHVVCLAESN